jgi:RimJ/RimL family protein N-acetyltransferase
LSELQIRGLGDADALALSSLLTADPPEYRKHFHPFPTDAAGIAAMLAAAKEDHFWGIVAGGGQLVAVMMLRGFDAGFAAPAFGVYVGEAWSRRGLATLALAFAQAWCRLNGCPDIMLTVHPDNAPARDMYEREGFLFSGEHSAIGHRIYRKTLSRD